MEEAQDRLQRAEKMLKAAGVWYKNPTAEDYMKTGMSEREANEVSSLNWDDELITTLSYLLEYAHKGGLKVKGFDTNN